MNKKLLLVVMAFLASLFATVNVAGHALDQGYVFLTIDDASVSGHIDIAMADINTAFNLSLPTDDTLTMAELAPHLDTIRTYLREHVSIGINGGTPTLADTEFSILAIPLATYLQLNFSYPDLSEAPTTLDIEYSVLFEKRPDHRGMAVIETFWKAGTFENEANISLVFSPDDQRQTLDLSHASRWTGFVSLIKMGTHHIWIGIDHILFLLALLLPAVVRRENGKWKPVESFKQALIHVVKIVTVFTIAHTITLSFAALTSVDLSSRIVESVIAISIAIAALDILLPIFRHRIWLIVFAFGLFHGFGFASVLGEIGIPSNQMAISLLGFNIGVEIGQVAIVFAIFPILYLISRKMAYSRYLLPTGAVALIAISLYWFTERAFEVDLPAGAVVNHILSWFS